MLPNWIFYAALAVMPLLLDSRSQRFVGPLDQPEMMAAAHKGLWHMHAASAGLYLILAPSSWPADLLLFGILFPVRILLAVLIGCYLSNLRLNRMNHPSRSYESSGDDRIRRLGIDVTRIQPLPLWMNLLTLLGCTAVSLLLSLLARR